MNPVNDLMEGDVFFLRTNVDISKQLLSHRLVKKMEYVTKCFKTHESQYQTALVNTKVICKNLTTSILIANS